jgi:superfamily I DNA/RNA helicase
MRPTDEQAQAVDVFLSGSPLVIEAGAGTGKTSTLKLIAESTDRRGQYVAFNKAIVADAEKRFPDHVACNTAHSLAFRAVGKNYSHRLWNSARMKSWEIAAALGLDDFVVPMPGGESKRLAKAYLAGLVMKGITYFCQSADERPTGRFIPYVEGIDMPDDNGRRTYANNEVLRTYLEPYLETAWADLMNPNGSLPFKHEHYLKAWQLSDPFIPADYILFDEAQDANPVMLAIVQSQDHAQRVYVGDSQQEIYGFTGAVNAMGTLAGAERVFLTQSFRFGPAIAETANEVLDMLGAELRLKGLDSIDSRLEEISRPEMLLTRTNAAGVREVLMAIERGEKVHVVGGAKDIVAFAKAAGSLMEGNGTSHPELACFDTWLEVQEYVDHDQQGDELRLMVKLVDEFGPWTIVDALEKMPTERQADRIVSTAHKAKGREWAKVKLAADFPVTKEGNSPGPEELRLLYVAVTRAKNVLDVSNHGLLSHRMQA